jgi:hypothetical protein
MTVEQLYDQSVKPLTTSDRLRLATMILNDISPRSVIDDRDEWSEDDLGEFRKSTWGHIEREIGDETDA